MTKEVNSILNDALWKTITGQLQWGSDHDGNYFNATLDKVALVLNCYANGTSLSMAYYELPTEQLSWLQKCKVSLLRWHLQRAFIRREKERRFERRRQFVTEALQEAREKA